MNLAGEERYRRVHVLHGPVELGDAASFLTSALLVSNGVRRDSLAAVEVSRGLWLLAPGDRIRHLRPDADTAEGWVRAVLRGKRGLGGFLARMPPEPAGRLVVRVLPGGPWVEGLRSAPGYYMVYGGEEAADDAVVRVGGAPSWLAPAIVNVVLDRLDSGLGVPGALMRRKPHE